MARTGTPGSGRGVEKFQIDGVPAAIRQRRHRNDFEREVTALIGYRFLYDLAEPRAYTCAGHFIRFQPLI